MSLQHPIARVRGLGSAKNGTHHWWVQRLTAVALALLTPWFIWLALCMVGADAFTVRATLAQPLNAVLMLAFVFSLFWHARLGLQVVIEDYIHTPWLEVTLQVFVMFACALAALASAIAIGRIVFTG
ncbi:succinate dehydrogenase, hydrophobic membrane anchor protein [Pseudomarimonas salicorniae]|uniref:Succinate dehydrogenase hydrophobic membrane anchor subunit n=1 Tax=Pseudomarimonas salicorniae TaxID=2933270 RepID=A0ABT0GEI9_9GAMM|nr:succinate dehydrogenase, hydrophobic membrane anchor protein [Lysobacter sp. CAU 1642]MCK7592951.1 succinate dehydrogenase, hydrophobic membrane anchor protein [Lysobacter sp. CAU 1642]